MLTFAKFIFAKKYELFERVCKIQKKILTKFRIFTGNPNIGTLKTLGF